MIGSTEEEARRKARDLDEYRSDDGLLAHISRDLGVDLGLLEPDRPIDDLEVEGVQGLARFFEEATPGRRATATDIGSAYAYNTRVVGTPETIADALAEWQEAGIDGVNVVYQTTPGSFVEFINEVVPVLRHRGLAQTEYAPGTFRERLFPGRPATLNDRHPAARYRGGSNLTRPVAAE